MPRKGQTFVKQEHLSPTEAGERLGCSRQRLNRLAIDGIVSKRMTDGKFPWPRVKEQYAEYLGNRREQVVYSGGNIDQELSDGLAKNAQSPAPEYDDDDPDDVPVMDRKETGVDYNNLSLGEQVIHSIQNRIKGSEKLSYSWSRALKEAIDARSAMLKLLDQEGKTLERAAVESWLYNVSRHNRDLWLNWPQLVSNEIAEELGCDSNLLYDILIRLVRENLERIATLPTEFEQHNDGSVSEGAKAPTDTAA